MNYPGTFELPTTDKLTELLTSVYYRHLLREQLISDAEQSGNPLTLFLFDIDNFDAINKTHGHTCGDRVLTDVAGAIKETMPEAGVLSRYGGDEFAGALPDTRLDDAFTLAEELRRRVTDLKWDEWPGLQISCSIGLAAYPANGTRDIELMREADQALYTAKSTGRNKVALPLSDSRMITKTSHYTATQLERLSQLAKSAMKNEASLLREALDDLFKKYNDRKDTGEAMRAKKGTADASRQ